MQSNVSVVVQQEVVPLPFNEVLQTQSIAFWRVSRVWNGRSLEHLTTGEAFDLLNGVLKECNPARPLASRINVLKHHMVEFGCKPKVKIEADNVNARPKLTVL